MEETDGIHSAKNVKYTFETSAARKKAKQTREKTERMNPKKSHRRVHIQRALHTQIDMQSSGKTKVVSDRISHAVKTAANSRHEK